MGNCLPPHIISDNDGVPSSVSNNVLEQAVSHNSAGHELYKLANYQKGGALIDAYHRGGSREVEKIAKQELPPFMYGDGEGAVLRHELYVQWRQGRHKEVKVPVDNLITSASSTTKPTSEEYRICWRLNCRGMLGESLLHLLILCNTTVHTRIARVILKLYPRMVWDFIEGDEYLGAGVLHLSIAYQNTEIFHLGVSSDVNINQRATGRFFLPYDQQKQVPKKQTDFEGLCYMGEYALAWAACCEDEAAYNMLLHHGADPNLQDTYGNMILHVVVVRDKLNMFGYALRHPTNPAKDDISNKYGLTPLTLACKLGRNNIFREMLELSALEFWRYSNITCSGYPLNALDSILPNGKTNWNSALIIILNGKTNEHLDMLDGGVIQRLLEEKWKTFARNEFLKRLAITFLHLIALSMAVYLRPPPAEGLFGTDARSICRYTAEFGTCLGAVSFVVFQQGEEIKAQGLLGFLFSLSGNPSKAVFLLANVLVMLCVPFRLAEQRLIEDLLLIIAIPSSWFFLIFFAGAVKLTGPFVTMIYNMLVGDIFRFSIIYLIFLLGFTQAFYFLFKGHLGKSTRFETYPRTWMSLFHMTLGFYEYREFNTTLYSTLTWLVFAVFMVIMPILLLNMLIAMMGNTYCEVITQSQKEWVNQWAKIVVVLERGVSQKKAKEFIQSYSIPFRASSPEDDPEKEIRAVMVIKSKPKSKSKQRKGAICNWKRMGKRVIQELRQPGVTSTSLLQKFNSTSASKLHTGNKSDDDSDSETTKQGVQLGLESALKQLAFASDLNFSTHRTLSATGENPSSTVTAENSSFGDVFQQVAWTRDFKVARPQDPTSDLEECGTTSYPSTIASNKLPDKNGTLNNVPTPKKPGFLPALSEIMDTRDSNNLRCPNGARVAKESPPGRMDQCKHHCRKGEKHKKHKNKKHKRHFRNRAKVGVAEGVSIYGKDTKELEKLTLTKYPKENYISNMSKVKEEMEGNQLVTQNGRVHYFSNNETDSDENWSVTGRDHGKYKNKQKRSHFILKNSLDKEEYTEHFGSAYRSKSDENNESQDYESQKQ